MITLGRLNLHLPPGSTPGQQTAWHRQAINAIGYADLLPRGLLPHAVLIIRRLEDPQPGCLLKGHAWQAGNRWGDQARAEVERMWRKATRPTQGPVPQDAPAVWFANPAEWLASLSIDIYQGVAHLRWWWQTRLNAPTLQRAASPLATVWQEEAQWLPAAFAYLHEHSRFPVAVLAGKLSPLEIRRVRLAVIQAHSLPGRLMENNLPVEAWRGWIPNPEKIGALTPETRETAALVLAAYYAPAALRQSARVSPLPEGVAKPEPFPVRISRHTKPPGETHVATADMGKRNEEAFPSMADTSDRMPAPAEPPEREISRAGSARFIAPDAPDPPGGNRTTSNTNVLPNRLIEGSRSPTPPKPEEYHPTPGLPSLRAPNPLTAPKVMERVEGFITALGGAWFLINILVALDLLDGEPSPWLKLEVLSRRLLGNPPEDDPLWAALAELTGRDRTPQTIEQAVGWLSEAWAQIESWLLERLDFLDDLVLVLPAHGYITPTHIHVVFSIEDIHILMRKTGLDRDPGWVPELVRVIQFHFE